MPPHLTTKRLVWRSAFYAAIISTIGLLFGLISILSFNLVLFPLAGVTRMINVVLLLPSTLFYGLVFDPFSDLSREARDFVSAGTSLLVYFLLFLLMQIAYRTIREFLHTKKPGPI